MPNTSAAFARWYWAMSSQAGRTSWRSSALQKRGFDGALGLAEGDDSLLHGVEIVPSLFSQKAQPNVQDRRPDPNAPIRRVERKGRKLQLRNDATEVRRAISDDRKTAQSHKPLRSRNRFFRPCERSCDLEHLLGNGPKLQRPLLVIECIEQLQFECVRDELKLPIIWLLR